MNAKSAHVSCYKQHTHTHTQVHYQQSLLTSENLKSTWCDPPNLHRIFLYILWLQQPPVTLLCCMSRWPSKWLHQKWSHGLIHDLQSEKWVSFNHPDFLRRRRCSGCQRMQSAILFSQVRLSVRHSSMLYRNECTYRQFLFHHLVSVMTPVLFSATGVTKFQRELPQWGC